MGLSYSISYLRTKVYSFFYKTILYRLGFGGRIGKEVWEKQYSGDTWEFLYSEDETEHYKALIKQVSETNSQKNVLDIGCGEGVLYGYLNKALNVDFSYSGIDISETAVTKASQKYPGSNFKVVDYDFEKTEGRFDLIIFNEVLYYFVKPMKMIQKAIDENLADGGMLIISMCDEGSGRNDLIWKNIDNSLGVISHNTVRNAKGWTWNIKTVIPLAVPETEPASDVSKASPSNNLILD